MRNIFFPHYLSGEPKKSFSEQSDRRGYSDKYCGARPETGQRKV